VERVLSSTRWANEPGFAAGYLRLRRVLASSSEKPIHLGCDLHATSLRLASAWQVRVPSQPEPPTED